MIHNNSFFFSSLRLFWKRHPALVVGVIVLLQTALYTAGNPFFYLPLALVLLPFFGIGVGTGLLALTAITLHFLPPTPIPDPHQNLQGTFYPHSVKEKRTPFGPQWEYQGTLALENASQLPIKVSMPAKPFIPRPSSDYKYLLTGAIKEGFRGPLFIPRKHSRWVLIEPITFGVGEWRYHAKTRLKSEIRKRFSSDKVARFMEGISTGDFQDRVMTLEFGRFGLQHIMAVSGFHFAIITGILCWVFFGVFGRTYGAVLLLTALVGYFVFLGGTPSITRAWITASILMIGILLGSRTKSLNSLGIGLFVVIVFEPSAITQIGFQFSFAITAAILLLTSPFEQFLTQLFPTRRLYNAITMPPLEKGAYLLLQWLKKGMALSFAVNVCALPMTLFIFGKFPLWSLFFNLFFPMMVAIAILFLILGLTVGIAIEFLGYAPNTLNNWYTEFMLNLAYNFPQRWDVHLEAPQIPLEAIVLYLTLLFTIGALLETANTESTEML